MKFAEKVYQAIKKIPAGRVATYSQIAALISNPKAVRAVGQALNKNPYAPQVPCHRVVASSGHLCGFAKGLETKKKILQAEGIIIRGEYLDLKRYLCKL